MRELYIVHTSRENLDIAENYWFISSQIMDDISDNAAATPPPYASTKARTIAKPNLVPHYHDCANYPSNKSDQTRIERPMLY